MGFMTAEHSWKVHERLAVARALEEGRAEGMAAGRAEGKAEGAERAEARYSLLIDKLLEQGRFADLERCAKDPAFRESLFHELD